MRANGIYASVLSQHKMFWFIVLAYFILFLAVANSCLLHEEFPPPMAVVLAVALLVTAAAAQLHGNLPYILWTDVCAIGAAAVLFSPGKEAARLHACVVVLASIVLVMGAFSSEMAGLPQGASVTVCVLASLTLLFDQTQQDVPTGSVVPIVLSIGALIVAFVVFVGMPHSEPPIGTFGVNQLTDIKTRRVIFHLNNTQLGSWQKLDRDEDQMVNMEVIGDDAVDSMLAVSIEQKGNNRDVPNLKFECDGDCEIYEHFDDEYEDWWLVFGGKADQTHFRQLLANEAFGVPSVMLEVFTARQPAGVTYEGVAMLLPAFKRDLYNKVMGKGKGKIKCDETHADSVAIAKYDHGNVNKNAFVRRMSKRRFTDSDWKSVYPNAKKVNKETCPVVVDTYVTHLQELAEVRTYSDMKALSTQYDLETFAKAWIWEMILQDPDFGFRSQYFALYGNGTTLAPAFLWDFNNVGYKGRMPTESFRITNVFKTFGWNEPLPIFQAFCRDSRAFLKDHREIVLETLQNASTALEGVHQRYAEELTPPLQRAFEVRNRLPGTRVGTPLLYHAERVRSYYYNDSLVQEQQYQYERLKARIAYVKAHWESEPCTLHNRNASRMLLLIASSIAWYQLVAVALLCAGLCCRKV